MARDDDTTPIAKQIARLAARRTDAQNDAIRRHAARIAHDFRTGTEPSAYPEGYGADMDDFLRGLSQKWHVARNSAPALTDRNPVSITSFRPRSSNSPDPFDDQEPLPSDSSYDDDNDTLSRSPDSLMKMAASALSQDAKPYLTDVKVDLEGTLVCIWRCGPTALIQYADLKGDLNSIVIGERRFFLNEYSDPRFAYIAGLSFDVLVELLP